MSKSKPYIKLEHESQIIQQRKRRKLSPNINKNYSETKLQNRHQNNRNIRNHHDKYQQDLYQTNKYLQKKLQMIQQSHSEEIAQINQLHTQRILKIKQETISKQRKLESKATKLSTNLKKLGKMYQNLQNEYDALLHEHQHVLDIVNGTQSMHRNTVYDDYADQDSNHDQDITIMEIEEDITQNVNKENEYDLLYINGHKNDGVSLQWNEGTADEFNILERNMEVNNRDIKRRCDTKEDNMKRKSVIMNETPIKYVETVRGKKRNELPGHECAQCQKFYALNNNMNQMTREKFCNCVSRHRAKHEIPATPKHFWDIDFATQQ